MKESAIFTLTKQHSHYSYLTITITKQNNAANKKLKSEPDSTPEIIPSEAVTAEEEEEEDDGFEYDPLKHMCIYCRHQVRLLRN